MYLGNPSVVPTFSPIFRKLLDTALQVLFQEDNYRTALLQHEAVLDWTPEKAPQMTCKQ